MQEIKIGDFTICVDEQYGGLYDIASTGEMSKVLHLFGVNANGDDSLHFHRFPYAAGSYRKANEEDILKYGCFYFDEEGNRPLKRTACDKSCPRYVDCFMTDEKLKVYKANYEVK